MKLQAEQSRCRIFDANFSCEGFDRSPISCFCCCCWIFAQIGRPNGPAVHQRPAMMAAAHMGISVPGMQPTGFAQPYVPQPAMQDPSQVTTLRRIFVGGVPFDITADQVRAVFSPFGLVTRCDLLPDPTNPARHRCVQSQFVATPSAALTQLRLQRTEATGLSSTSHHNLHKRLCEEWMGSCWAGEC